MSTTKTVLVVVAHAGPIGHSERQPRPPVARRIAAKESWAGRAVALAARQRPKNAIARSFALLPIPSPPLSAQDDKQSAAEQTKCKISV